MYVTKLFLEGWKFNFVTVIPKESHVPSCLIIFITYNYITFSNFNKNSNLMWFITLLFTTLRALYADELAKLDSAKFIQFIVLCKLLASHKVTR